MIAVESKVPVLRFPEFEGDWENKPISEISVINPKSERLPDSFIYIDLESVEEGRLVKNEVIELSNAPSRAQRLLKNNDVIFQMVRPYQKNNLFFDMGEKYVASTGYAQIRALESPHYLYHYLHTDYFVNKVLLRCTGTNYPAINSSELAGIHVAFPSLPEQQKIAAFLTAVDAKIELLTRKKALLEQYKKGVMQQIFSQKIRFKDDNGEEFPEWEEKRLGQIVSFVSTNSYSRNLLNYESGTVKNIHYGDIHTKFKCQFDITKENVPFINEGVDLSKIASSCYCQPGDLIIADASEDYKDIGKAIEIVRLDDQKLLAGLHTYIARDKVKMALGFKSYLMQTGKVRRQMMEYATGISVLGISKSNLEKVSFLLPSYAEQKKIVSFLNSVTLKIETTSERLCSLKIFKKSLLQQLFV